MNHDLYIGKRLKDLIKDCHNFALNFYLVGGCGGGYKYLKDIMYDKVYTHKIIKHISHTHTDYSIYIELEG